MDRITGTNAVDIGGGKLGFRDRNLAAGITGTAIIARWLNGVQEELLGVIEEAGLTPDDENNGQLLAGLQLLFGGGGTLGASGWQRLPGGLIVQWGTFTGTTGGLVSGVAEHPAIGVSFPRTFPTACFGVIATALDVSGAVLQEHAWVSALSPAGFNGGLSCRQATTAMTAFYVALGH